MVASSDDRNWPRLRSVMAKCAMYICRVRHAERGVFASAGGAGARPPRPASPEATVSFSGAALGDASLAPAVGGASANRKNVSSKPNFSPLAVCG